MCGIQCTAGCCSVRLCSLGIETVCLTVAAEGCNGKIRSVGMVLQATVVNIVGVSVVNDRTDERVLFNMKLATYVDIGSVVAVI